MSLIFGLPANVVYATAAIYALLVFATIVVWVLRLRTPGERYRELAARVDSWWWMIGAFTLAILFNQTVAIVFLGFIAYLALKEYLSLVPTRRIDRAVLLFAYLAIPGPDDDRLHAEPYGLAPRLGGQGQPGSGGVGLLFFLVVLTQFNDVAQYCWGKLFGRHKVTLSVSPKKTWEGLIGGVATTIVVASLFGPYLTPMDWRWSALAGGILGISGFLGDIIMSAMKRDLGVKDTGGLIPGHGGILDRVDSLTYAAPVFVHFIRYFFYP